MVGRNNLIAKKMSLQVSIPYRCGTTALHDIGKLRELECQFLIGTVRHENPMVGRVPFPCQFLIGMIRLFIPVTPNPGDGKCQFLIGMIRHLPFTSNSIIPCMCQFLIGMIRPDKQINEAVRAMQCQFLIGTVRHNMAVRYMIKQLFQFLTGTVRP